MSNRVNEIRKEKGMTLEDIASACNVTPAAVCRFAQGTKDISFALACRMADVLGVTVDEIRGDRKEVKKDDRCAKGAS